jgi:hypothetical protein
MKISHALIAAGLAAALPARAVYAPVPEQKQGEDLSGSLRAGLSYDSNIFGGATDAIGSAVWELAPRISYNHSLTEQTFISAAYGLTLTQIDRRPGDSLLDSHDLTLRAAHAFSKSTTLDVNDTFMIARNPESLLNGVPLNTDQSFTRNQVDGRLTTAPTAKLGVTAKVRSVSMDYRNATLGRSLDRVENLYGLAGDYGVLPETKAVLEYRHQDVFYWTEGETKNKRSEYLMAGTDYEVARKLTLSTRFGAEWRRRSGAGNTTGPFAEVTGRYQYAEKSFLTGGYAYTLDESSDTARFTDQKVNRFFVNVEHSLTALIVASVSANYEPAVLQGRRSLGIPNLDETATRLGAALSYLPTKNWTFSASFDWDNVSSDDPARSVRRNRVGMNATYAF